MPPLEAWEKVFVGDKYLASIHSIQNCTGCHGGVSGEKDKDAAHEGVVRDPAESGCVCGVCHSDAPQLAATSLHRTVNGFRTMLTARGADLDNETMQTAFNNHCNTCHATCGQCHISRPNFTAGGLIKEHEVKKVASTKDTCMACHGARVSNEYMGKNEGVEGSVHFKKGMMSCFDCHEVGDFHGDGTEPAHRYEGAPSVNCLDCHPEVADRENENLNHNIHLDQVDCAVCHASGPYKSCSNCHVALDEKGLAYFETDESQMTFKIGLNTFESEERPYEFVLVRHVPVAPDTFAFYGENLLPEFDNVPTWKHTRPHHIVRNTTQNESCNNCHGNAELFLTSDDVVEEELAANVAVIVEEVPPKVGDGDYPKIEPRTETFESIWLLYTFAAIAGAAVVLGLLLIRF